ncbi:anthranilate phosphoribosyltransferase [Agaribacter flavus]|uniref:Anthranilate phosphoribosyltransferase n=1 Tax=Agaribacter flavus TaxID=1902781 RepID=A0ABV7FLT0_9ALTE
MDTNTLLERLYAKQDLSQDEAHLLFARLMRGELSEISITALLIALKLKGESSGEIAGAAAAMIEHAKPFSRPDYAFSDIVGTGGDGHNTINISSAAALVAASCGVKVAKHGNKSVSSKSGSSDLFANFGLALMMSPETARQCLDEANFCFLAAPNYHAGVKHVMGVRGELKTRTLFNILGPLANPSRPTHGVYGVYSPDLVSVYAEVLHALGHEHALVVHGSGLDEIALHDKTTAIHLQNGRFTEMTLTPEDFGASRSKLESIKGGEPAENKNMIAAALSGKGQQAHVHAIAMNAAALLWVNAPERDLKACFAQAVESMNSGLPLQTIQQAASLSQGN